MRVNFIYVRHGETIFNQMHRIQGRSDSPLTKKGIRQMEDTASLLRKVPFQHIFCSTNGRAMASAAILAKYHDVEVIGLKELEEFNFGDFEGEIMEEVKARMSLYRVTQDWKDVGGEDLYTFQNRVEKGFKKIIDQCKDGDNVLIVGHSSFIIRMMRSILNYDVDRYEKKMEEENKPRIPNGCICQFIYENGKYTFIDDPITTEQYRKQEKKEVTFYYVRHGETFFNKKGIMQGRSGSYLTPLGETQARKAAEELKGIPFQRVYVSPLQRTRQMASIMLETLGDIPLTYEEGLIETCFGSSEGTPYVLEENVRRFNHTMWRDLGGEDLDDVKQRIDTSFRNFVDEAEDGDTVLIVGHGDYYLVLVETVFGINKIELEKQCQKKKTKRCPQGGIACIQYKDGKMHLKHLMMERLPK